MLRVAALLLTAGAAAADFRVKFEVEVPSGAKEFTVLVHEDWAPIGAARFRELVEAKFYDDTRYVAGVGLGADSPSRRNHVTTPHMALQVLPRDPDLHGAIRPQRRPRGLVELARQDDHRRAGQGHQQAGLHDLRQDRRAQQPHDAGTAPSPSGKRSTTSSIK